MIWPKASPHICSLPQLSNSHDAHLDPMVGINTNDRTSQPRLPHALITCRSLYLMNCKTNTVINAHVRTQESLETYGENVKVKRSYNGFQFIIQTSKNYLLIYSILDLNKSSSSSMEEVLSIYDKQNHHKLLQNGFPGTDKKDHNQNLRGFFSNLFAKNEIEYPNYDLSLRFKLVLKIQSELIDFITLPQNQVLLFTRNPKALQLIQIGDSHSSSNIEVTLVDELDWYSKDRSDIKQIVYDKFTNTIYWSNTQDRIWSVKVQQQQHQHVVTAFHGTLIYEAAKDETIEKFIINHQFNTIAIVDSKGNFKIAKLRDNENNTNKKPTIQLISTNQGCANRGNYLDLEVSPCGSCYLLLFDKGWYIYTSFGNLNFSTFDFNNEEEEQQQQQREDQKNWCSSLKHGGWSANNELFFINDSKIFIFNLIRTNTTLQQNSLTMKRVILFNKDYISVFKGYEKPLNDYSSHSEVLNNKEAELWYHIQLPTTFKLKNSKIVSLTASQDGRYICCCGDKDLIIYNGVTKSWKFLINDYTSNSNTFVGSSGASDDDNAMHPSSNNNILQSLWFENYLILAMKADDPHNRFKDLNNSADNGNTSNDELRPTTEILIFSNLIWKEDVEFNPELCIWNYTFSNIETKREQHTRAKPKEDFLYFNIDNDSELIVLTTELNCYFFNISKIQKQGKNKGSTLQNKCDKVFSLKKFFTHSSGNKLKFFPGSIKSINKVQENDLLILVNGDVIYLRQSVIEEDITMGRDGAANLPNIKSVSSMASLTRVNSVNDLARHQQQAHHHHVASSSPQIGGGGSPEFSRRSSATSVGTAATTIGAGAGANAGTGTGLGISLPQGNPGTTTNAAVPTGRKSIRFEKIVLSSGIETISKLTPYIISMFNGTEMIYFDLNVFSNARLAKQNMSQIEPMYVNIDDENNNWFGLNEMAQQQEKKGSKVKVTSKTHANIYPFETIWEQNCIIGFKIEPKTLQKDPWFNFVRKSVRKDFLSNLLDYFLRISDVEIFKTYSEIEIYEKYSKYKNYQFCLEILVLNYLTGDNNNNQDEKLFSKLINLIRTSSSAQQQNTNSEYLIYLSLLKKIEVQYWFKFFKELGETPRQILNEKILPSQDYKLSCHYLILTMNYERQKTSKETETVTGAVTSTADADANTALIDDQDKELILEILGKLVNTNDFQICFELIRYIKFMDEENNLKIIDEFLSTHDTGN